MKIRSQVAWLGALSVLGAAACGGTAFNVVDSGGEDASQGSDGSKPDARNEGGAGHEGGALDAGHAKDATEDHPVRGDAFTSDAPGDAGHDVFVQDAPAPKDGGKDTGSGMGDDAGVDAGHDAGPACATKQASESEIFLAANGSTAATCGKFILPCGDLPSALSAANVAGINVIYVGPGVYAATAPIALQDGITLSGGWTVTTSGPWTGSCDPMDTPTFEGSGDAVLTVGATTPSAGHITLDTVNVTNTATATAGESVYGIMAVGSTGSDLVLNNVSIKVPSGGAGAQGASGQTGSMGATGAPGCPMTGGGGTGTTPSPIAGTYGPTGYTPQGTTAHQAGLGATGATPSPVTTCPPAADGSGTPGHGNPTACSASSTTCNVGGTVDLVTCAPPANSGCGGGGGTGGFAGGGGGASIALFLWGENATLDSGAFVAANGGAGGQGGTGGPGGPPGKPAPGGATAQYHPGCHEVDTGSAMDPMIVCELEALVTVTATPGGAGGTGGTGGTGAGGAGGDSYSYYLGNGSMVTVSGSPTFTSAAMGGAGGSPNGLNGYTGQTNTAD